MVQASGLGAICLDLQQILEVRKSTKTVQMGSSIAAHKVPIRTVHFDTTSLSVHGEYEGDPEYDTIDITYGFSKDKRPDLKQIVFGVGANHGGVPMFGEVLSGNHDDTTWNGEVVERIDSILPEELVSDVIYVADSSMVTVDTLGKAHEKGLKFVSRMPSRFKIVGELARTAWEDDKPWKEIGRISSGKKAASYRSKSYSGEIDGVTYRFVVVHSSALDQRNRKALDRAIEAKRAEIEKAAEELRRRNFVCEPDAKRAIEKFIEKWSGNFHELSGHVSVHFEQERRKERGRPPKDAPKPPVTVSFNANIRVLGVDEEQVKRERQIKRTFVLITNLLDEATYPDEKVLCEYKEQPTVENLFSFIKSPYVLGPVFVKKQSTVEALGYVLLMALLVAMLLQRRVRENLAKEGVPLPIPGKVKTLRPTACMIFDMLDTIRIQTIDVDGTTVRVWPEQDHLYDLSRLLTLAGLSKAVYAQPPASASGDAQSKFESMENLTC